MDHFPEIARWYLISLLAAIAFAPIVLWFMSGLSDRGASFVRPISALLLIWPAWYLAGIGSGIVPFGATVLWITVFVVGIPGWFLAVRSKSIDRETVTHLLVAEAGFFVAFAFFAWLRGFGPQIEHQEKLSDLMMLSSSMKAISMPPSDAWLAGEGINYYYGGYVIWGGLARMVNTTPAIAYNLALISVFATTFTAAVGLVANTAAIWTSTRTARLAGLLGGFLIIFSGTLWAALTGIRNWSAEWDLGFFSYTWSASRSIQDVPGPNYDVIAEFPAFSFLLGDLHPHLLALPYAITALGIALTIARLGDFSNANLGRLALATIPIGALYAINSWDFPTYLAVGLIALVIGTATWTPMNRALGAAILIFGSVIAWLPFYVHFETPTRSSGSTFADVFDGLPIVGGILASVVKAEYHTSAKEYLGQLGFPWLVALALIGIEIWRRRESRTKSTTEYGLLGAAAILILVAAFTSAPVLILAGIPILAVIWLIASDQRWSLENVALGLFALGFALTIIPEVVILRDAFVNRMNTMFKVYYQVWVILAVATALALAVLWRETRKYPLGSALAASGLAIVVLGGSVFPVLATQQWFNFYSPQREWVGWNGTEFLETNPDYAEDVHAYQWLIDHADQDDVMLATGGCEWSNNVSRTASATGIPTLIGWPGHEGQWHLSEIGFDEERVQRVTDINTLGGQLDPALVDQYGITLVFVGYNEQSGSSDNADDLCAPGPFLGASNPNWPGPGWTEVYNENGVRIYRKDGT